MLTPEQEHARKLAEACLIDRITTTFAIVGEGRKGRVKIGRVAPATPAEIAWTEYCASRA